MTLRQRFEVYRGHAEIWLRSLSRIRKRVGAVAIRKVDFKRVLSMDLKELPQALASLWQRSGLVGASSTRAELRDYAHWPRLYRQIVLTLSFICAFGIAVSILWSDPLRRLEALSGDTVLLKARYLQLSAGAAMKSQYEQQTTELEVQFGELLEMIPASLETVQVLHQISEAARASGLRLQWFKPSPEIQADAYAVLPVEIRLTGSYHAVGRFMEAISRMKHLITVDVMLEALDAGSGELALATKLKAYRGDAVRLNPPVASGQGTDDAQR